jgi:hypothetical protein
LGADRAILAAVGVPLWLCAAGILTLLLRNRGLRARRGNVPVRFRRSNKNRWIPGHGVWIHDVFAYRGLPAAWKEALVWGTDAAVRVADDQERQKLHRIGDEPVIVTVSLAEGGTIELATRAELKDRLLGPFAIASRPPAAAFPTRVPA